MIERTVIHMRGRRRRSHRRVGPNPTLDHALGDIKYGRFEFDRGRFCAPGKETAV